MPRISSRIEASAESIRWLDMTLSTVSGAGVNASEKTVSRESKIHIRFLNSALCCKYCRRKLSAVGFFRFFIIKILSFAYDSSYQSISDYMMIHLICQPVFPERLI